MIIDVTQNLILVKRSEIANSMIKKIIGLMFKSPQNLIFIFSNNKTKVIIHTLFVFYTLFVILLDEDKKVIEKAKIKPFSFYLPKHEFSYLIELVNMGEKFNKIKIRDKILWE